MSARTPQRIGPYQVLGELARGNMGVVYRALDPALEREVAVKVMLRVDAADALELERFRREARATARLRHPGIVALHTVGSSEGHPYLVMDLVEGESLLERVEREGPLAPREAARICAPLAEALAYAHARGVLHRDVKPGNVLLDREGTPYLTDFGLARRLERQDERLTATGEIVGTPAYMAPEQAHGDPAAIGPAADVYGLGGALYECLTGRPPYTGANLIEVFTAVVNDAPTRPAELRPGLDPALEAICLRCLEKQPAARFPDAQALAQALRDTLQPAAPAARSGGNGLWRLALAATLLACLALGVGWSRTRSQLAAARARLEQQPTDTLGWLDHAEERIDRGEREGVVEELDRALALAPRLAAAYRDRAALRLEAGGDPRAALQDCERSLALDPGVPGTWSNRAAVRLQLGDVEGAAADARRALELKPGLKEAAFNLGLALARQGQLEEAERNYTRALGGPSDARTLLFRAMARVRLGRPREALKDCERVLAEEPEQGRAWAERGYAHQQLDQLEAAAADWRRALELLSPAETEVADDLRRRLAELGGD